MIRSIKQERMRRIWFSAASAAGIVWIVYLFSFGGDAYPGLSASATAAYAGLLRKTGAAAGRPLLSLAGRGLAAIPASAGIAWTFNLFSSCLGAVLAALVFRAVWYLARLAIGDGALNGSVESISRCAGWGAALLTGFSLPVWSAAAHFTPALWDAVLCLGFLNACISFVNLWACGGLIPQDETGPAGKSGYAGTQEDLHGRTTRMFAVCAVWLGLGCAESAVFLPLGALAAAMLFILRAWSRECAAFWKRAPAAGFLLFLVSFLAAKSLEAAASASPGGWGLMPAREFLSLTARGVCRQGLSVFSLPPGLDGQFAAVGLAVLTAVCAEMILSGRCISRGGRVELEDQTGLQDLHVSRLSVIFLSVLTVLGLWEETGLRWTVWDATAAGGRIPVIPGALASSALGLALACWWALFRIARDRCLAAETPLPVSRRGSFLLPPLAAAAVFAAANGRVVSRMKGDWAAPFVRDALRNLDGHSFLFSNASCVPMLRLEARRQGLDVEVLNDAAPVAGPAAERLRGRTVAGGKAGTLEKKSAAGFLRAVLAEDPEMGRRLAAIPGPALWDACGALPVAHGFFYGCSARRDGAADACPLWDRQDCGEWEKAARAALDALPGERTLGRKTLGYETVRRAGEVLSAIANNIGVAKEGGGEPKNAPALYDLALRLNPDNVSARLNRVRLSALSNDGRIRPEDKKRLDSLFADRKTRETFWALADRYGYLGGHEIYLDRGWPWAVSGDALSLRRFWAFTPAFTSHNIGGGGGMVSTPSPRAFSPASPGFSRAGVTPA